ncbi:MAG: hypothetical protein K2X47_00475 [Bdellovibrionales bacterium]|nr:hypothetical protein [Bdellovibrionales bacterium]
MKIGRIFLNLIAILVLASPLIPSANATPPACRKSTEEVDGLIEFNGLLFNKVESLKKGDSPYADTLDPLFQEYSKMLSKLNINTQEDLRSDRGGSLKDIGRAKLKVLVNLIRHMNQVDDRIKELQLNPRLSVMSDTLKSGATALQAVRLINQPVYCSQTLSLISPRFREELSTGLEKFRNPALETIISSFENESIFLNGPQGEKIQQFVDRSLKDPEDLIKLLKLKTAVQDK